MRAKRFLGAVLALALFAATPLGALADDGGGGNAEKTLGEQISEAIDEIGGEAGEDGQRTGGYAKTAEDSATAAKDALDSITDGKEETKEDPAIISKEAAEEALNGKTNEDGTKEAGVKDLAKDVDDALGEVDATTGRPGDTGTAKTAINAAEDAIKAIADAETADEAQGAITTAESAVNTATKEIKKAVDQAADAVDKAQKIVEASNHAATQAATAAGAADTALEAANKAEEAYQKVLQTAVDGDVDADAYKALAAAEKTRNALWNEYAKAQKKAEEEVAEVNAVIEKAAAAVSDAYKDARKAQEAALDALDTWNTLRGLLDEAQAKIAEEGAKITNDSFKELLKLRDKARDAALNACTDARAAALAATELYVMALDAEQTANGAKTKANAAVAYVNGVLIGSAETGKEAGIKGEVAKANVDKKFEVTNTTSVTSENAAKSGNTVKAYTTSMTGTSNTIKIHGMDDSKSYVLILVTDAGVIEVPIEHEDGNNSFPNSDPTVANNKEKYLGDKDAPLLIKDTDTQSYYWISLQGGNNWGDGNGSGAVNFKGDNLTPATITTTTKPNFELKNLISDLKDLEKGVDKANDLILKELKNFEALGLVEPTPSTGGSTPPGGGPGGTTPIPPTPEAGGGPGGDTPAAAPATTTLPDLPTPTATPTATTTIPDADVPLAQPDTVTIVDEDVPLASLDTVTIQDENVPLAELPTSGGSMGAATTFGLVKACLPPVRRRTRRYRMKKPA